MNPKRKKLLLIVVFIVAGMGAATGLALKAFQNNLLYFFSPTQVVNGKAPDDAQFRIGGLVEQGSVKRDPDSLQVSFVLTDTAHEVKVVYDGILPDLFREGQGIVADGRLKNGQFVASQVLAKHDATYMPPEVADALKKAGVKYDYKHHRMIQ